MTFEEFAAVRLGAPLRHAAALVRGIANGAWWVGGTELDGQQTSS